MRTRIKFCGMTRAEDVRRAAALGVDALGFIFAAASRRRLALDAARALRADVPDGVEVVALFMDNPGAEVDAAIAALRPTLLQFHGGEDDAFCRGFGLPFVKTLAMGGGGDAVDAWTRYPSARAFLLDGHRPGEPGGNGARFDWSTLPPLARPVILAGGLDAGNVGEAIRIARPFAVDVCSGIESAPGRKDGAKMQQFVEETRRADRND